MYRYVCAGQQRFTCWYNPLSPPLLVAMRRADQHKVSALQSRSPSRKSVAKAAARHPRPALLHGSARRKAPGEHSPPDPLLWIERVQAKFCFNIKLTYAPDWIRGVWRFCSLSIDGCLMNQGGCNVAGKHHVLLTSCPLFLFYNSTASSDFSLVVFPHYISVKHGGFSSCLASYSCFFLLNCHHTSLKCHMHIQLVSKRSTDVKNGRFVCVCVFLC